MKFLYFLVATATFLSCGEEPERYEQLSKIRGLGVSVNPLVPLVGTDTQVSLNIFAAVPTSFENIDVSVSEDKASIFAPNSPLMSVISVGSETYGPIRILNIQASAVLPPEALMVWNDEQEAQFRYGFKVSAPGQEDEKIVGSVLVVRSAESPKRVWAQPTISIDGIGEGANISKDQLVKVTIVNEQAEEVKAGWFVSSGEIKNRRSYETQWQNAGDGEQVIIGTVRGMTSRSFAMDIRKVSVGQ
jgi:hypothetical protein